VSLLEAWICSINPVGK